MSSSSGVGSTQTFSGSSLSSAAWPSPTSGTGPITGGGASPGEHRHAFEFAREAVLARILAGRLRLLGIEERRDRRGGGLGVSNGSVIGSR